MSFTNKYINIIKTEKVIFYLLIGVLLFGFLVGLIFANVNEKSIFTANSIKFFVTALSSGGKIGTVILGRFFAYLLCLFLLLLATLSLPFIIVNFVIIFYNAYLLGALFISLVTAFKLSGFVLYVFAILILSLTALFGFIILSAVTVYSLKRYKDCKDKRNKLIVEAFLITLLLLLLALLVTIIFVLLILRPLNLSF